MRARLPEKRPASADMKKARALARAANPQCAPGARDRGLSPVPRPGSSVPAQAEGEELVRPKTLAIAGAPVDDAVGDRCAGLASAATVVRPQHRPGLCAERVHG